MAEGVAGEIKTSGEKELLSRMAKIAEYSRPRCQAKVGLFPVVEVGCRLSVKGKPLALVRLPRDPELRTNGALRPLTSAGAWVWALILTWDPRWYEVVVMFAV